MSTYKYLPAGILWGLPGVPETMMDQFAGPKKVAAVGSRKRGGCYLSYTRAISRGYNQGVYPPVCFLYV